MVTPNCRQNFLGRGGAALTILYAVSQHRIGRAFILAMRDRDRANKNEIEIFVFSVTTNDFPHDILLLALASNSSSQQTESRSLGRVHAMQATVSYRVGH